MEKLIATIVVKITWLATFFVPINKNKITFISYFDHKLTGSFKLISDELLMRNKDYKLIYFIRKFNNSWIGKLLFLVDFSKQTYHINTSSVVLLDGNNFPVCQVKKKKQTTVIQLWHACGGIKKFGCDIDRRFEIKNYDYIYVAGKEFKKTFSSAFNVSKNQIISLGVAKTDILYSNDKMNKYKKDILKRFPQLKGKKVILYAPTFRGDGAFDIQYVNLDLEKLSDNLGKDYIILYKLHPFLDDINLKGQQDNNIINANKIDIYRLFSVTDVLISDYSAVIFDFSILEKPIVLYTPDLEKYERERGFYYDYRNFAPGPICYNEDEIIDVIKNEKYTLDKVRDMKYTYFDYHDGKSTDRIVDHIEKTAG